MSLELGVGNGNQARVWLDEFLRLDRERGQRLLPPAPLPDGRLLAARARPRARERQAPRASASAASSSTRPADRNARLSALQGLLVYISNVYDNLPTDEIVRIGGHLYQVEVRAYLPTAEGDAIATGAQSDGRRDLRS